MSPDDLIYLAYPIDQADYMTEDGARLSAWVAATQRNLRRHQQPYYDPGAALTNWPSRRAPAATRAINNVALGRASGLLALLPPGIPTTGTPMEIERARYNCKPVAVIHEGEPSPLLHTPGIALFDIRNGQAEEVIRAATDWLVSQDNGNTENPHRLLATKQLTEGGNLPVRMFDGDAGFDLLVSEDTKIPLGEFVDVPCGIAIEPPPATWGLILGRSSTLRKRGLIVTPGIIDSGYRGPLFAGCYNIAQRHGALVERGERLAQLIPFHCVADTLQPTWVAELGRSDRGERGFGSSGT